MNKFSITGLALAGLLVAQGCQSIKPIEATTDGPDAADMALPFPEPEQVARELDEDLVFSYLVGEIGAHRGELRLAQTHYQHAAVLGQDAYAAERATRIALHLRDYKGGLTAARRWVALAPNDLAARQLAAVLFFRNEQPKEAGEQLDALIKVADARGIDGFLQAAGVFSVERAIAPLPSSCCRACTNGIQMIDVRFTPWRCWSWHTAACPRPRPG